MVEVASPITTTSWRSYRVVLASLIVAAWLILMIWAATPYAALLDHHEIEEGGFSAFVRWSGFLAGWTLMVLAMMLPGSLPAVRSFLEAATAGLATPWRLFRWYLLGYLVIWLAFGATIYLGDTLLHGAIDRGLLPHTAEPLIPVVLLAIAGSYQFTPLKQRCRAKDHLEPSSSSPTSAAGLGGGLKAGALCVGTCGATMLIMFGLGGGVNLAWMAALTAFTVLERTTEAGRRLAWPLGFALILWAALKFIGFAA